MLRLDTEQYDRAAEVLAKALVVCEDAGYRTKLAQAYQLLEALGEDFDVEAIDEGPWKDRNVVVPGTSYIGTVYSEPNAVGNVRVDYQDWTGRHLWGSYNCADLQPARPLATDEADWAIAEAAAIVADHNRALGAD